MASLQPPTEPGAPFALHVADLALQPDPLPAEQIISGSPEVNARELWSAPDSSSAVGVWEITPGVVSDVEVDEAFVVISGRATIAIEGGPTLEVGPGDVATLRAGDRTVWTVHETLRKVYSILD